MAIVVMVGPPMMTSWEPSRIFPPHWILSVFRAAWRSLMNTVSLPCAMGTACSARSGACVESACGGVTCQSGSQCDMAAGRCMPGCNADADCGDPMTVACNVETGQCFNKDGSCDDAASEIGRAHV